MCGLRGRGGDRGGSRGRSGGFRGGSRGRDGGDREEKGGGFRGSRGNFRGSDRGNHGGDRGGRGSWADSDRGSLRGASGSTGREAASSSKNGRDSPLQAVSQVKEQKIHQKESEIKLGLQIYVTFKNTPVAADELEKLPGFHSVCASPTNKKKNKKIILFKDIESLGAAKAILDAHENVQSTQQMGFKTIVKQYENACKVYLSFCEAVKEEVVKKLDDRIKEVTLIVTKSCVLLQFATLKEAKIAAEKLRLVRQIKSLHVYEPKTESDVQEDLASINQVYLKFNEPFNAEAVKKLDNTIKAILPLHSCNVLFATREEAESAAEKLKMKIGENSLRIVDLYSPPSKPAYYDSVHQEKVVLRDVPKEATPEDFASLFPDALAVVIYKNTFPASKFCHAYIGFENAKRVAEILNSSDLHIAGKKVFPFPAYSDLLQELPDLGEIKAKLPEINSKEEPPSKKRKVEEDDEEMESDDGEEDEVDEEGEEEGDEEGEEEEDSDGEDEEDSEGEDENDLQEGDEDSDEGDEEDERD